MEKKMEILFVSLYVISVMTPCACQSGGSSFFGWSLNDNSQSGDPVTQTKPPQVAPASPDDLPKLRLQQQQQQVQTQQAGQFVIPSQQDSLQSSSLLSQILTGRVSSLNTTLSSNLSSLGENQSAFANASLPNDQWNVTSPLASYLGNEISSFITTTVVFLGAALGRAGCDLKAACLAGSLVPPVQGRDLAMVAAEPLVPEDWKVLYLAAKSSMIQGQDCNRFNCF